MAIRYRTKAFERLWRKVEALRMTLPDDEREILDSLIKPKEVEAHKIANKGKAKAANQGAKMRTQMAPEVEAHAMTPKAKARAHSRAKSRAQARKAAK